MTASSNSSLPSHAQTVIIGGGSIGCNTAYQLTKLGMRDVVVLERDQLTSGTTWHAAGLIVPGFLTSEADVEIYQTGRDLYARLEEETELSTGFRDVGYLQVATGPESLDYMRRGAAFMRRFGFQVDEVSPREAADLFPIGDLQDVVAGFYMPDEGRANPVDVTMSLAKGARMGGARIFEGVSVDDILVRNGTAVGVRTDQGDIMAENVVICAGMWSREIGARAGINLPLQAAEHYYLITETIDDLPRDLPVLEDAQCHGYFREEVGGLMIGLFEPGAAPWNLSSIPKDFSFGEIDPDWDRMMPHLEKAYMRVPSTLDAGVRKFFCGPESFTPDMAPLVGEVPELRKCFVAAGLNSLGILNGAGIGKTLAHWIVEGRPHIDVTGINVSRFSRHENTHDFRRDRTPELLKKILGPSYPNEPMKTARNVKCSVLHERLRDAGAYFVEGHGWEMADWFAPSSDLAKVEAHSWKREHWFAYHREEHLAARTDVVLMDMSFMGHYLVQGRDACALLNRLSCNEIDVPPGQIVYTQWTNEAGGIEADLTITRLSEQSFMVICGDNAHGSTEMRMHRAIGADDFVTITDVTSGYSQLNVHGPKARALLQSLTHTDLSNEAFPFMAAKMIDIGYAEVLAIRVTYIGELGWELHISNNHALQVYDAIVAAGKAFGLRHAGMQALSSLRLEKAYRDFAIDIDNTDNPIAAGLGFAVKLDKPGGFIGRDALAAIKARGVPRERMLQFLLKDPEPLLYGAEPIYCDGVAVGHLQVGAYGFSLGGAVGIGFVALDVPVTAEIVANSQWQIDVAGTLYPAEASLKPMFDPAMKRIKC